jgi:hypothetical protein
MSSNTAFDEVMDLSCQLFGMPYLLLGRLGYSILFDRANVLSHRLHGYVMFEFPLYVS